MKKQKCGYADKYKATKAPTCGCITCEKMWSEKNSYEAAVSKYFTNLKINTNIK